MTKNILDTLIESFAKSYRGGCFFMNITYIDSSRFNKYSYELLFQLFSSYESYLPISTMVGMPEMYMLGVGMDNKMLAPVCWNLICFLCFCAGKWYIYFRKTAGKYTSFKQKCWKNFCNNLEKLFPRSARNSLSVA